MTADAWGMLLAVKRRHEAGAGIGTDQKMAQEAGIAPAGQLVSRANASRASVALVELHDMGVFRREGGDRIIDAEALARAVAAA